MVEKKRGVVSSKNVKLKRRTIFVNKMIRKRISKRIKKKRHGSFERNSRRNIINEKKK